jgi:phosphoglycolate phosphatase-like HAD superfamily hydrolase
MKTVAVDFDGVLNTYTGWQGEDELFDPREGVEWFLDELTKTYEVVIYTTRDAVRVMHWLEHHGLAPYISSVENGEKPKAVAYLDDRAVRFDGDYRSALHHIDHDKVHWGDGRRG